MKPSRSGKNGALIGGAAGLATGTYRGVKKVKANSEDGTFKLTGQTALEVGKDAARDGVIGAALGLGVGELGDQLLSGDGVRAAARKGKEAAEFADQNSLQGEAKDRFVAMAKNTVKEARQQRMHSQGNRALIGRGDLGWFKKNNLTPTPGLGDLQAPAARVEEFIAAAKADTATPMHKLQAALAQKDLRLVDSTTVLTDALQQGPDGALNYLKAHADELAKSSNRDVRALGKYFNKNGEQLLKAFEKALGSEKDEYARLLQQSADGSRTMVAFYKKLIAATAEAT